MAKKKGSDGIIYNVVKGTLISAGVLAVDSWFKIKSVGTVSALPVIGGETAIFKSPKTVANQITLGTGDSVYPLTLTEVCKVDIGMSSEMGTIDTTDSCDEGYMSSIPDGIRNISGTIGTMLRFDEETEELVPVTEEFLNKFFDVIADDGEGAYVFTQKNEEDVLLMILVDRNVTEVGKIQTWFIVPAIISAASMDMPLKDVLKNELTWTKGQGLASIYKLTVAPES